MKKPDTDWIGFNPMSEEYICKAPPKEVAREHIKMLREEVPKAESARFMREMRLRQEQEMEFIKKLDEITSRERSDEGHGQTKEEFVAGLKLMPEAEHMRTRIARHARLALEKDCCNKTKEEGKEA